MNPPINLYSVPYENLKSAQLATVFAMGPICFQPAQPYLQVDALLHLDSTLAEEDGPAEARVRAGLKIGAGDFLKDYIANHKEHQTLLSPPRHPQRLKDRETEDLTEKYLPGLHVDEDAIDMAMETTLMAYLEKQGGSVTLGAAGHTTAGGTWIHPAPLNERRNSPRRSCISSTRLWMPGTR